MLDYLKIRRDLHQIPEIGLDEYKTHTYLMQVIDGLTAGLNFVEIRTWRTGILVFIKGSSPDKTIGWRTDIDGLPIVEKTGLDFASTHEGRMHACGHDMHMTVALGLLEQAVSAQPTHNLSFSFSLQRKMKLAEWSCMKMALLATGCRMSFTASMCDRTSRSAILPLTEERFLLVPVKSS